MKSKKNLPEELFTITFWGMPSGSDLEGRIEISIQDTKRLWPETHFTFKNTPENLDKIRELLDKQFTYQQIESIESRKRAANPIE